MKNLSSKSTDTVDQRRVLPLIDRYFLGFLALQLVAFPLVPALPLVIAFGALATPLRLSPGRMAALWAMGAVLTLIVVAPHIIDLVNLQIVDESAVQTVTP